MGKALLITEKPSVARDIAATLGGMEDHDGYFEGDDYVITFAVGHLFELMSPEELDDAYKRWTLDALPIIPETFKLKPKAGQRDRIATIKKLIFRKDVDRVINACDAGREGELIFREIVDSFETTPPIYRLWLQSMTSKAILKGLQELRPGVELEPLADAARCRSYSDWMIGMNATRAITKRLKSRKEKTAWSAGRVQTPTLALLVDRELEVLAHVPRPYWRIEAKFSYASYTYVGVWFDREHVASDEAADLREDRIFEQAKAERTVAAVRGQAGAASETRKPSKESAPPLFDLTSLQRECNRRFGWSARRALNAAQRCYEGHKVLTYPRTSSRCLPEDYRSVVTDVIGVLAQTEEYAEGARALQGAGLQNEERIFNNEGITDHFAVIPTGVLPATPLTGDDKRLFDLVVRRFLGAFFPPAVWERVERTTVIAGQYFRTRARSLQEPGWRLVLGVEEESEQLPALIEGVKEASDVAVRLENAESLAEQTKPPARISEARLLSLMENAGQQIEDENVAAALHEKGIGTPATRADIIENLISKGYVVRAGKSLRPSVKGIRLIDSLRRVHIDRLASPQLTGELEMHLLEVERGQRSAKQFMEEVEDYTRAIVERAKTFGYDELYGHEPALGPCPACSRPVREYAWFYRCEEKPDVSPEEDCSMRFWKDTSGRYLNREVVQMLLQDGQTAEIDGFTAQNGRTYKGVIEIDRDEWKLVVRSTGSDGESVVDVPEYEVNDEPLGACPLCADGKQQIVETATEYVCQTKLAEMEFEAKLRAEAEAAGKRFSRKKAEVEFPKTCGFVFPRTVCKREITRDEAQIYLQNRRTDLLTEFTSRFGRPFQAILVLKETGRHGFEFLPRERKSSEGEGNEKEGAEGSSESSGAASTRRAKGKAVTKASAKKASKKKAAKKKSK